MSKVLSILLVVVVTCGFVVLLGCTKKGDPKLVNHFAFVVIKNSTGVSLYNFGCYYVEPEAIKPVHIMLAVDSLKKNQVSDKFSSSSNKLKFSFQLKKTASAKLWATVFYRRVKQVDLDSLILTDSIYVAEVGDTMANFISLQSVIQAGIASDIKGTDTKIYKLKPLNDRLLELEKRLNK
jgi:hypothetical protein